MDFLEKFSKYQKFILLSVLLLAIIAFFSKVLAAGVIFAVFLYAVAILFINKNKNHNKVLGLLFLTVFLIHISSVLFIYYAGFQPFNGGDYREYNSVAQDISSRVHQGNFSLEGLKISHYYPVIVGYIYALTIPDMLMGELLNAWVAAILVIFAYFIVIEIGGSQKEGFLAGLIINIYPSFVFFSSLMLKDVFVALLSVLGLLFTLKIIKNFSWDKFFILYLVLIGLTHLRFYISFSLVFTFIICWLFLSNLKIKERLIYGFIMIILLGFLPNISSGEGGGLGYFGKDIIKQYLNPGQITHLREIVYAPPSALKENQPVIEENQPKENQPVIEENQPIVKESPPVVKEREENEAVRINENESVATTDKERPKEESLPLYEPFGRNESSFVVETNIDNPFKFFVNYLRSFIYVVLGPFPWQMKQLKHFLALPEVIAWWFLLFFVIRGMVESLKTKYRVILPLVVFSLFVFAVLALFITNFGVITRIRIPALISLSCLLPLGFKKINTIKIPFLEKYITI